MRFLNFLNEANVANVDFIEYDLLSFAKEHGIDHNKFIKNWLLSTIKKFMINTEDDLTLVTQSIYDEIMIHGNPTYNGFIRSDKEREIIKRDFEAGRKIFLYAHDAEYSPNWVNLAHVADWFKEEPPSRDIRMTLDQAVAAADKYFAELTKKASKEMNPDDIKVLKKYPNGSYWCKILTDAELLREGNLMNNCIGVVYKNRDLDTHDESIISFRTSDNIPHVSMRCNIKCKMILECKGNSNSIVKEEYWKYVIDSFNILKIRNPREYCWSDLNPLWKARAIWIDPKTKEYALWSDRKVEDISFELGENKQWLTKYTVKKKDLDDFLDAITRIDGRVSKKVIINAYTNNGKKVLLGIHEAYRPRDNTDEFYISTLYPVISEYITEAVYFSEWVE